MHPAARLGLPVVAAAAGLPALLAGMIVAPAPHVLVGPRDDTVRTMLVDAPPSPVTDDRLGPDGAHPPLDPSAQLLGQTLGGGSHRDRSRGVPVRVSGTALPARVLLAYRNAAAGLRSSDPSCHLSWSLLAGIGQVESGQAYGGAVDRQGRTLVPILGPVLDGTGDVAAIADTDGGHWDGDSTWDRAVGPMQFIPSSWAIWGRDGDGSGAANPSDVDDAALAAASYLCAGGGDLRTEKDRRSAVFSYNHSWDYVALVLAWADAYATGTPVVTGLLAESRGHRGGGHGHGPGADGGTPLALIPGVAIPGTVPVTAPPASAAPPDGGSAAAGGPTADAPVSGGAGTADPGGSTSPAGSADPGGSSGPAGSSGPTADGPTSAPGSDPGPASSSSPSPTDTPTSEPPRTASPSPSDSPTTSAPTPTCPTPTPSPTDSGAGPAPTTDSCPTPTPSPSETTSPATSPAP